ncbi:unnamed protein product [Bubo scandiacus]
MVENKANGKGSQALKLSGSFSKTSDKRKSTASAGKPTSAKFSRFCFEPDNLLMSLSKKIPMPEISSQCFDISKLSLASFLFQSHPTCCGPDLTWHLSNINGHSPLIHNFLQSCNAEPWSGQDILICRREISNPVTRPYKICVFLMQEHSQQYSIEYFVKTLPKDLKTGTESSLSLAVPSLFLPIIPF